MFEVKPGSGVLRGLGIFGVVLVLAIVAGGLWIRYQLHEPLSLPEDIVLDVSIGSSLTGVAQGLNERGVLAHPQVLAWYGRLTGQAGSIHAGEYVVSVGTTAAELLQLLVEGRVKLHSVTIIEGWTVKELLSTLRQNPAITVTLNAVEELSVDGLTSQLNLDIGSPEGWFFPDTYLFARGETDANLLGEAHENMQRQLLAAWDERAVGLPYTTPYEALILASIVERETALDSERRQVAGVFIRRLQKGMRLQTDPTVIFGLGDSFDGNLTRRHLKTDTVYNTYTRKGLPPTPIALPGAGSLQAAMNPDNGDTLYFVATGEEDGSHYFSKTLAEHNAAVSRYLRRLREKK